MLPDWFAGNVSNATKLPEKSDTAIKGVVLAVLLGDISIFRGKPRRYENGKPVISKASLEIKHKRR